MRKKAAKKKARKAAAALKSRSKRAAPKKKRAKAGPKKNIKASTNKRIKSKKAVRKKTRRAGRKKAHPTPPVRIVIGARKGLKQTHGKKPKLKKRVSAPLSPPTKPVVAVSSLRYVGGPLEVQAELFRFGPPTRYYEPQLPWAEPPQLTPESHVYPNAIQVVDAPRSQNITDSIPHENNEFWAFVDSFLKEQTSLHTRRAYEKDLMDFLGYLRASSSPMNVHTLIEYRNLLETRPSERTGQPISRVSINRKIATLKSFLNFLVLNGVIPNNPAKAVKSFRAGRESPTRDIPDDMVRRMLELPNRHTTSGRMHKAILMVLFHLGLRRSELIDLRTSDFFEESGVKVMRVRGKGDKERLLPVPAEVYQSITDYLLIARKEMSVDQILFTPARNNSTGVFDKHLNPEAVAYIVKHYAAKAGVPYKVSPHSARATAVSNALDHMASHRAVQHMAGWSSPLMVTRYDKRKADLKNSAVRFVDYKPQKPKA